MSRFLLSLSEFNRIHQVAHGVLQGVPEARADRACMFFASFGAYILATEYKIPARVVAGAFSLCLAEGGEIAFFGKVENNRLTSGPDAFHMWIQTASHIVDFMAPIFPEAFAERPSTVVVPRKMLQRRLSEEAADPTALKRAGDFRYYPDPDLTEELIDHFLGRQLNADLLQVAIAWFGSRRGRQAPTFAMGDEKGQVHHLALANTAATGSW